MLEYNGIKPSYGSWKLVELPLHKSRTGEMDISPSPKYSFHKICPIHLTLGVRKKGFGDPCAEEGRSSLGSAITKVFL